MYALNTFLRVIRFLANSLVGILVGFALGYMVAKGDFSVSQFLFDHGF